MNEESTKSFQDSLVIALNLFNNHEWYEAHDAFEEIWNSLMATKDKLFKAFYKYQYRSFI